MVAYHAKKRLGQNFLKSDEIIARIIDLLAPLENRRIVEIGSGRGALSLPLAQAGALLWAIEFDRDLQGYLKKLLRKFDNAKIIPVDFLTFDPESEQLSDFSIVGNIPYNITSPVIDWCVKYHDRLDRVVLMVQKEPGHRLAASPGSKAWAPISIFAQWYFDIEVCIEVPPESFVPPPAVSSAVIRLTPIAEPPAKLTPEFEKLVRQSFTQRRKTLVNNLVPVIIPDAQAANRILETVGLKPACRAEEISIEQFLKLTNTLIGDKLL